MLLVSVVLTATTAWRTLGPRPGLMVDLVFDGQHWSLCGQDARKGARISVVLDMQFLVLVRLDEPAQHARWLWLERRARPEQWQDLRRAIYSRVLSSSVVASEAVAAR